MNKKNPKPVQAELVPPAESKELISLETLKPEDVFKEGGAAKILAKVKALCVVVPGDITDEDERARIKREAMKVTRTKTGIVKMGDDYVRDLLEAKRKVDGYRKEVETSLEGYVAEIRRPVEEYDAKESARKAVHNSKMDQIRDLLRFDLDPKSEEIEERIKLAEEFRSHDFEEFKDQAATNLESAIDRLNEALNTALSREEDERELARFRAEKAEREKQKEIDDAAAKIANDAIEAANKRADDAEAKLAEKEEAPEPQNDPEPSPAPRMATGGGMRTNGSSAQSAILTRAKVAIEEIIAAPVPEGSTLARQIVLAIKGGKIPNVSIAL